ncbi:hypothetical protein CPB86DRAFT_826142 [Serendipita vermifera]|nr:hypothetical protein CPB86DRAFT_826142 [Serendipita vermifera]
MSTLYIFLDWVDVDCGNLEVFQTLDYWWLSIPPSHLDLRITGLPESVQASTSAANSQNRLGRGQFFTLDDTVVGNVKKIEVAVSLPDWLRVTSSNVPDGITIGATNRASLYDNGLLAGELLVALTFLCTFGRLLSMTSVDENSGYRRTADPAE